MIQPFRIAPAAPVTAFQTYELRAPAATHWRKASCKEVECAGYREGWRTIVPVDSPQAQYIRAHSGRSFTEHTMIDLLTEFTFPPGQQCFAADGHRVPLERDPLYIVRGGDWRGNPTGMLRRHQRAEHWVEDFGEHQLKVARQIERG